MRISDWSSDVCSSDLARVDKLNALAEAEAAPVEEPAAPQDESLPRQIAEFTQQSAESVATLLSRVLRDLQGLAQIGEGRGADYAALGQLGSASCRERVCQYV